MSFFVFLALRPAGGHWGLELRAWVALYPANILLATQPTNSVFRYLMLAQVPFWPFPEAGEQAEESRGAKALRWLMLLGIVGAGLVLQYLWVTKVFTIDVGPDHQSFP